MKSSSWQTAIKLIAVVFILGLLMIPRADESSLSISYAWASSAGPGISPDEALSQMQAGNKRYYTGASQHLQQGIILAKAPAEEHGGGHAGSTASPGNGAGAAAGTQKASARSKVHHEKDVTVDGSRYLYIFLSLGAIILVSLFVLYQSRIVIDGTARYALTLKSRLALYFSILIALVALSGSFVLSKVNLLGEELYEVGEVFAPISNAINRAEILQLEQEVALGSAILAAEASGSDAAQKIEHETSLFHEFGMEFEQTIDDAIALMEESKAYTKEAAEELEEDMNAFETIREHHNDFEAVGENILGLVAAGRLHEVEEMEAGLIEMEATFIAELEALGKTLEQQRVAMLHLAEAEQHRAFLAILAMIIGMVVFGLAMSAYAANAITKPIGVLASASRTMAKGDFSFELQESKGSDEIAMMTNAFREMKENTRVFFEQVGVLTNAAKTMAGGDFTIELQESKRSDEIATMTNAFRDMRDNTRALIAQVSQAASNVASSSEELAAGADETGKGIQQVSETVQEVAKGSQETTKNLAMVEQNLNQNAQAIEGVSKDIEDVAAYATQAASQGIEGKKSADEAAAIINQAAKSVQDTTKVVHALGDQTKKIAEFIGIITAIADQTNLLALNAAIEAARAGEAGRGFAVVAEEVRKLAEESNDAAGSITKLVQGIENEMQSALAAMEKSDKEVSEGAKVVGQASEMLSEIVHGVEALNEKVQNISSASEQINASTTEVVEAISSVSAVSQQNAAGAQQMSAATQQQTASMQEISANASNLAKLAQDLQEEVGKFKV